MTDDDCVDTGASNCDEAMERLYEYLDEEMDEATAEGIRSHLNDCGDCHGGFDFERRLKMVVRERLAEEVPLSFINRLRSALDREAAKR
jgi:mycothiol system anti-sigma-R factor